MLKRDFKIRYHRSVFGFGWTIIKPLAQLAVFSIVFDAVLDLGIPNYVSFVFVGVLAWSWFNTSIQSATMTIVENAALVRRPGFTSAVLPTVVVLSNGIHFALAFPLLVGVVAWQTGSVPLSIIAVPAVVLCQGLFILAIAYAAASLTVLFRDFEHMISVVLMLGFYMTPVFYRPLTKDQSYSFIHDFNPMAWILELYRVPLIEHRFPDAILLFQTTLLSAVLLIATFMLFRRLSDSFVDRL